MSLIKQIVCFLFITIFVFEKSLAENNANYNPQTPEELSDAMSKDNSISESSKKAEEIRKSLPDLNKAQDSIHNQAKESSKQQGSGNTINLAIGGALGAGAAAAAAAQNYGLAATLGAMSLMSMAQALNQSGASDFNAGIAAKTAAFKDSNGNPVSNVNPQQQKEVDQLLNQQKSLIKTLANKGYKIDPKNLTLTTPQGKVLKPKDFASEKSMIAAGIPPSVAATSMEKVKQALKDLQAKMAKENGSGTQSSEDAGLDGGGGAGGSSVVITGGGSGGAAGSGSGGIAGSNLKGRNEAGASSVSGMTKDFNGEKIGVAGDNIFKMMNRSYIKNEKLGFFY